MTIHDLARLHTLQSKMGIRRNWVAVGHLQALIDEFAGEHDDPRIPNLASVSSIQIH